MEKILEVKNISKKYQNKKDEVLALKNINFCINEGEFVSIIGPSGCGKSTLLSIISGLEDKTTGEIYIENEKIEGISPKIGYMLQKDCLLEWRTILSNALFGLEVKGKVTKEELDKCSTCDMNCTVNDGLSSESRAQLDSRTGEEIVDADIRKQLNKTE